MEKGNLQDKRIKMCFTINWFANHKMEWKSIILEVKYIEIEIYEEKKLFMK